MANEVVKHHNDLNTIPMRNWTKEEMNFFFSIISRVRETGTREVIFDKLDLAELANYSIEKNKRYEDTITGLVKNVAQIHYIEKTKNSIELMNLFNRFKATWSDDLSKLELIVKVSTEFEYVLNRLDGEFTTYELSEFTQIRSTYAKTLYRLLKQWRTLGKKEYSIDELKRLVDTPSYYTPSEINKNVLTPARKELPIFFQNFKVKPIKSNKRGTPVIAYLFTWKPEKTNGKWIEGKYDSKQQTKKVLQPTYSKEEEVTSEEERLELLNEFNEMREVQTTVDDFLENN